MGMALARAAAARGWAVTLLLGPTQLADGWLGNTSQMVVERFQSVADLQRLLAEHWPGHDVLIMAAAVADYRPVRVHLGGLGQGLDVEEQEDGGGKLRRGAERVFLELEPTPDLLAELAGMTRADQTVIGFALEPAERLMESAWEKLARKRLDGIVANPLETMDSERVTGQLVLADGRVLAARPGIGKDEFAEWLLGEVAVMVRSE